MIKEKSCGAIIYKQDNGELLFLSVKHNKGHVSFPKGHVEDNETEEETAIREIKEETNIDVKIDTGFRRISTYSPKPGVIKDVIFFVGEALTYDTIPQEEEIQEVSFMNYNDLYNVLAYEKDKKIFEEANVYILDKIKT